MNQYATDFSKALNLGIYGADLGYVSMYNKTQDAISYLAVIASLLVRAAQAATSGTQDSTELAERRVEVGIHERFLRPDDVGGPVGEWQSLRAMSGAVHSLPA